jgi:hypothetical protein
MKEIINLLKRYTDGKQNTEKVEISVLQLNRVIKALEQQSCKDMVNRQVVLDFIKEVCFSKKQEWVDFRFSQGSHGQRNLIINFIESLPNEAESEE